MKVMEAALAQLPDDYAGLLQRHAKLHGELFNRMRLDLGGGADQRRTTEELIAESTYEKPNRALIEKEFDAARYNIISCTGKLPPNLQGVWVALTSRLGERLHAQRQRPVRHRRQSDGQHAGVHARLHDLHRVIVPWLEINAKHRRLTLPAAQEVTSRFPASINRAMAAKNQRKPNLAFLNLMLPLAAMLLHAEWPCRQLGVFS